MTGFAPSAVLTAILPFNDIDAPEWFYARLGFARSHRPPPGAAERQWRIPSLDGCGGRQARSPKKPVWPFLYIEEVDSPAAEFRDEIIGKSAPTWRMYEFARSDPNQTLLRVDWLIRLRRSR